MVRAHSDRLAIKDHSYEFSYSELDKAANRVAHAILEFCGERQARVGLLFEHGAMGIVAIIGVLKARKIYVFLDPSYPPNRIAYMVEDSQASLIGGIALRDVNARRSSDTPSMYFV